MTTLPPKPVIRAAARWLRLLRTSSERQGWAVIGTDTSYTDLTPTQYADALNWLVAEDLLSGKPGGWSLVPELIGLSDDHVNRVLFARALEASPPPWLPDADHHVMEVGEIPLDAATLATELGLAESDALSAIREVHGRIDLEELALIGSAGEEALVRLLEERWPGSTVHVALHNDGFGYDIAFRLGTAEWHLEVKTTTRRGRLVIHLSRHEYKTSLTDPNWRLVVVGLQHDKSPAVVGTIEHKRLWERTPLDVHKGSPWQTVRHNVEEDYLRLGLSFLNERHLAGKADESSLLRVGLAPGASFDWAPKS